MSEQTKYPNIPSNKKFGLFFSFVFICISIFSFFNFPAIYSNIFLLLSIFFLVIGVFLPKILFPFNISWYFFGIILNKFFSPIILGIIFYFLISPIAIITKIFGRDILVLKRKNVQSHWINCHKNDEKIHDFKNQF